MRIAASIMALAALALGACTTPVSSTTPSEGRDCFRAADANGYAIIDDHNIRVRVSPSRSYTLTTNWNANDLDWTQVIALRSDSGWICTGSGLGVEITGGEPRRTYPIDRITRDPEPPADQQGS